jgi:PAS domain S-box-containing protein
VLVDTQRDYAMFLLDPDGCIRTWNEGAALIKGYREDEILGRHVSVFYTPDDIARGYPGTGLETALREGRWEGEGWRVRKDGSRFWADAVITALYDHNRRHIGFGKVTRDLTSRRLAEEQLRNAAYELERANEQLQQFRHLVSSVRDYAIFMLDPGGFIRTWNLGAERLKGYTEDEIVGQHFSRFYTQRDIDRAHPADELEIAAREGSYEEEGWRVRKDGSLFWASVLITAVRNEVGTLVGFAKVTRDLTERRRAEEELARSNEELQRFAAAAAHDLVEPLHTMTGAAELLDRRYRESLDERGRLLVDAIGEGAGHMGSMVRALLGYARASQGDIGLEPVALGEVTAAVVRGLAARIAERGGTVEYDPASLPSVCGDAGLIHSVLVNLIGNALKFNPPGTTVRVTAERDDDPAMQRIVISDDGVGIALDEQARIFGIFQRVEGSQQEGMGLGLALAQRLVERQGGRIGVDSEPGRGSRFWFTLAAA